MPRKIEIEAYEFKELDEKAKEKAREWARDMQNECGDSVDDVSQDFKNTLGELRLTGLTPLWSLGYSQGDGVAFEGEVDLPSFVERQPELRNIIRKEPRTKPRYSNFMISAKFVKDFRALERQGVEIGVKVEHHGHYTHRNSMEVTFHAYAGNSEDPGLIERQDKKVCELEREFHEYLKKLSVQLEADGYGTIEGNLTNEHIDSEIEANGWLFTKTGKRSVVLPTVDA